MCLMACRAEYKMDYPTNLFNSLSRSMQNLVQSSPHPTHDAYHTFRSVLHSSSPFSAYVSDAAFDLTGHPTDRLNSITSSNDQRLPPADSPSACSLTQSICQSLVQSSGLVVRLVKFALDLYYCTIDLPFLIQLFAFGPNHGAIDLHPNQTERKADDKEDRCAEAKPERISFTTDEPAGSLPDLIISHQKSLQHKQNLTDIGRKLRFIAEQFEKQRTVK